MRTKQAVTFTEEDGHELAADLMRELGEHLASREAGAQEGEIEDVWKKDDSAILRRYLRTVSERKSPALERGFFAVVTDVLCQAAG